ncbi:YcnI family protein [Mycobacterium sp. MYCO198283]|uniref:YcnI family protein n=1 Tax=Mycobacterium sp. MYCO198283 TaxID=2883505 RepID=UPI001E29BD4B|nr:YcnI family protein [Mycobacterium sp. MYCO198283]MCG5433019.1 YcnI family protein [Mycobacterium sp. MYCO198283]
MSPVLRRALYATIPLAAAATVAAPTAAAHVHVDADDLVRGGSATLEFRVPGESDTGALTTALRVELPDVTSARTELMPGWSARLDRDPAAGTVRAVTWSAVPGTGISSDQFAVFRVRVVLPDADTAAFPAVQTYSDGTVVRWDQPTPADGTEPEHPVPELTLAAADGPTSAVAARPADATARWLGGVALVAGIAALVAALTVRRRS